MVSDAAGAADGSGSVDLVSSFSFGEDSFEAVSVVVDVAEDDGVAVVEAFFLAFNCCRNWSWNAFFDSAVFSFGSFEAPADTGAEADADAVADVDADADADAVVAAGEVAA